jgi:L-cysteine/cystine lyase
MVGQRGVAMSKENWQEAVRNELPALARCAYLNTGSAGPLPTCVADAMSQAAHAERSRGRGDFATFGPFLELRELARSRVARLLGADADEIALTHHTSDGINIVLWGLDWKQGDRLVTTTLEHDAVVVPAAALAGRFGVDLAFADIGLGERALAAIEQALAAPTKLLVLSHVCYSSGALLPVAELTRLAHARGALVLVDGAQSVGAMPVAVRELGVDYYTVSAQKWLCGPEGLGALFVRRDRLAELAPTFCSYFSAAHHDFRGQVAFHQDARRFESGMVYRPGMAGFAASLQWMLERVDVGRAWPRSLELASYARGLLAALGGVTVLTPAAQQSQLLSFALPAFPPAALRVLAARWGRERQLVVRSIDHHPYALRASIGCFNLASELELLVEAVREAVADGPSAGPEPAGRP